MQTGNIALERPCTHHHDSVPHRSNAQCIPLSALCKIQLLCALPLSLPACACWPSSQGSLTQFTGCALTIWLVSCQLTLSRYIYSISYLMGFLGGIIKTTVNSEWSRRVWFWQTPGARAVNVKTKLKNCDLDKNWTWDYIFSLSSFLGLEQAARHWKVRMRSTSTPSTSRTSLILSRTSSLRRIQFLRWAVIC